MVIRYLTPSEAADKVAWLTVSPLAGRSGLRVAGEVALGTRATWERALDRAVHEDADVYTLELSAVTFVDVAGAGTLALTAQRLGDSRRMVLHRPPHTLRRVLDTFWPGLPAIEVAVP